MLYISIASAETDTVFKISTDFTVNTDEKIQGIYLRVLWKELIKYVYYIAKKLRVSKALLIFLSFYVKGRMFILLTSFN